MLSQLLLYLAMLVIGALIGHLELGHPKVNAALGKLQFITLIFLLFIMGIRIGADEGVVSSIQIIGLQAFVIAFTSIIFSILFVKIGRKLFRLDKEVD